MTLTQIQTQADTIDAVMASLGIRGRVVGGEVTPSRICYNVNASGDPNALCRLREAIGSALGTPVSLRRKGAAIVVEVPRNPPPGQPRVSLRWMLKHLRNVPAMTAVLGIEDDGAPLLVGLPHTTVVVAGGKGTGKTSLLRAICVSLWYFTPGVRIGVVSEKTLRELECLGVQFLDSPSSAVDTLVVDDCASLDGLPRPWGGLVVALRSPIEVSANRGTVVIRAFGDGKFMAHSVFWGAYIAPGDVPSVRGEKRP